MVAQVLFSDIPSSSHLNSSGRNFFMDGDNVFDEDLYNKIEELIDESKLERHIFRSCPYCKSSKIKKYGIVHKHQRYKCNNCNRTFVSTNNTFLSSSKKNVFMWREFIKYMINEATLKAIRDYLKISSKTAYMWRVKLYKCFSNYQESTILSGNVWIDECFINVPKSQMIVVNGKHLRGISNNKIAICVGVDSHHQVYAKIGGNGHLSSQQILNAYGHHIKPGSYIIHDGFRGHDELIQKLNLIETFAKSTSKESKLLLQPVNNFISQIKRNLFLHVGGKREYVQEYLDWICFKHSIKSFKIDDKIELVFDYCSRSGVTFLQKDRY